jgi:DNA-binding SARP family transcriptional activator/tetratricopeptide (TPR) repeat protein
VSETAAPPPGAVEFRLLGEIEARIAGRPMDLGHTRRRCVLVVMLIDANRTVPVDRMVDRIWADHPPQGVRNVLYSYLSRLRQSLAGATDVSIVRQSGGYILNVDPEIVDLHRFRSLIAKARDVTADDNTALTLYEEALSLWQGEPFPTLDTPWFNTIRDSLEKERFTVELERNDLQLRAGRHAQLLAELSDRAASHPLDERLAGQLMLTLYRSGRAADALDHYERLRSQLANELGTDPSPPLQELHQQMLVADPALNPPVGKVRLPGTSGGTGTGGSPQPAPAGSTAPVPRQLPAPPRLFTGRSRELAELSASLSDAGLDDDKTMAVAAIGGAGGIGKTWLALQWAHTNLERFPDGQLYVNLRGFDPKGSPMPVGVAIRAFLDALGVEPGLVPADLEAQTGLYRSLVAGRRMLIVLDNARDTTQVEPLLPGSPSCVVLVTSRNQLDGLVMTYGGRPVSLDVLDRSEAWDLLARRLGEQRIAAEPDAVDALLERCAGLPLALGVVAARAVSYPGLPLQELVDELLEASNRLDALSSGDLTTNLYAVFTSSYDALDPEPAMAFRLLGLAPGPDIDLYAVSALTGLPTAQARKVLRGLHSAHLVQHQARGRYRMHDLLRLYALDRAREDLPADVSAAALRRLVEFYVHTAHAGDRLLHPYATRIVLDPPAGFTPVALPDREAAISWFDAEHQCLLAAQHAAVEEDWDLLVWQLSQALNGYCIWRGHLEDNVVLCQAGLAAAERLGDLAATARARLKLGTAHGRIGAPAEALEHLRHALEQFHQLRDTVGQAETHIVFAAVHGLLGDNRQALDHSELVLKLRLANHDLRGQAGALNTVGWFHAQLGDYDQAREYCSRALALQRQIGDVLGGAATLDSLAYIHHQAGNYEQALADYHSALTLWREHGHAYDQPDTLARIGDTYAALGKTTDARRAWQQAIDFYLAQHRDSEAKAIQRKLDGA